MIHRGSHNGARVQVVLYGRKYRAWSAKPRRGDGGLESIQGNYKNMTHKKAGGFRLACGPDNYWVMVLAASC